HTWKELHAPTPTIESPKIIIEPAYQVDWSTALEQDFPRANGKADIVDKPPPPPQDDDAYIRARMAEEGLPWESSPAPRPEPPPPPSAVPAPDSTVATAAAITVAAERKWTQRWRRF